MHTLFRPLQHGFTLIEVMVVLVIAGVLLALAGPSFRTTTQRFRALGEASALSADMKFARYEAIKQGLPVTICVSADGATCLSANTWNKGWIVFADPTANKTVGTILRVQKTWTNSDTFTADNAVSAITFSRDGFTIGLPGTGTVTITLHTSPVSSVTTQCLAIVKTGRQILQTAGTGACA